jgi:hypothetical protein
MAGMQSILSIRKQSLDKLNLLKIDSSADLLSLNNFSPIQAKAKLELYLAQEFRQLWRKLQL